VIEFLLFGSRSESSSSMRPMSWSTSDHIDEYFLMQFNKSTTEFAGMLECFLLSGLEGRCDFDASVEYLSHVSNIGTLNTYRNELLALKQKVTRLIFSHLRMCTHIFVLLIVNSRW
jgi:hypothetical protein